MSLSQMNQRAVRALIEGRVQGVSFRAFTQSVCSELGIVGWVRNLSNGSVEAYLEGERVQIEKALALLSEGPEGARVDRIKLKEEILTGGHGHFEIRRG